MTAVDIAAVLSLLTACVTLLTAIVVLVAAVTIGSKVGPR